MVMPIIGVFGSVGSGWYPFDGLIPKVSSLCSVNSDPGGTGSGTFSSSSGKLRLYSVAPLVGTAEKNNKINPITENSCTRSPCFTRHHVDIER